MDAEQNDSRKLPEALGSAEYRTRLATKLNCLIAVLEVAIAKISKSMDAPGADGERLQKIRGNLENTLSICHRAKRTLDRTAPDRKRKQLRSQGGMTARDYVELTSIDEYRKFRGMKPITKEEVDNIDFDGLSRRLAEG